VKKVFRLKPIFITALKNDSGFRNGQKRLEISKIIIPPFRSKSVTHSIFERIKRTSLFRNVWDRYNSKNNYRHVPPRIRLRYHFPRRFRRRSRRRQSSHPRPHPLRPDQFNTENKVIQLQKGLNLK